MFDSIDFKSSRFNCLNFSWNCLILGLFDSHSIRKLSLIWILQSSEWEINSLIILSVMLLLALLSLPPTLPGIKDPLTYGLINLNLFVCLSIWLLAGWLAGWCVGFGLLALTLLIDIRQWTHVCCARCVFYHCFNAMSIFSLFI